MGLSPGSGRSPRKRNGNPLQYSCLKNPLNRGAWQAVVQRVAKSWPWLRTQPTELHRTEDNTSAETYQLTREGCSEWTQQRKESQAEKGRCPFESNFNCHQSKSCDGHRLEALEDSSTALGFHVSLWLHPRLKVVLGQCLSNSWPAILWQQRVPNWGSGSSGSHSYWWRSRRCPEDDLPPCLNPRRFLCWALVVTLTPMEARAVPLLSYVSFCISVVLAAPSPVSFLILFIGESESEVAQSCPPLCDPVDCSPPGSSVHGILQARILEWVAISFSWLKVYQFCLIFEKKKQKTALCFMDLFYCFLGLYFIYFFSDVYDSFLLQALGFVYSSFSNSFMW